MGSLTFGEQAVGLTFNPSGNKQVQNIKVSIARIIDDLQDLLMNNPEPVSDLQRAEVENAINELKTAQMWAVKAVTRTP